MKKKVAMRGLFATTVAPCIVSCTIRISPEAKEFFFLSGILIDVPYRKQTCLNAEKLYVVVSQQSKMSVLNHTNHAAVEALCAGTYLESYLDTMESLPDDLQRNVTMLRELDIQAKGKCRGFVDEVCQLFQ